ncbi:MAG: preprotein translocase subunit SecE [Lachnospiraceae bacterium]|nr:preprotein translocase subunit SecE [Lachnospiraceae bacterium]
MAEEEKKSAEISAESSEKKSSKKDKDKIKKQSFRKGVRTEFKKITWPDKDSLTKQSVAVVCVTMVVSVAIAVLDFIIKYGVDWLVEL